MLLQASAGSGDEEDGRQDAGRVDEPIEGAAGAVGDERLEVFVEKGIGRGPHGGLQPRLPGPERPQAVADGSIADEGQEAVFYEVQRLPEDDVGQIEGVSRGVRQEPAEDRRVGLEDRARAEGPVPNREDERHPEKERQDIGEEPAEGHLRVVHGGPPGFARQATAVGRAAAPRGEILSSSRLLRTAKWRYYS